MRTLFLKEEELEQQTQTTLDVIYENWRGYQEKLRDCITPLTNEQLLVQPAAGMWPLGQIVQHIISVRAGLFSGTLQDNDEAMSGYMSCGQRDSPERSAAELARGLDETWAFIQARLQRWTPGDCAMTFPDEWDGQVYNVSRRLGDLPCDGTRPASWRRSLIDPWHERSADPRSVAQAHIPFCFKAVALPPIRVGKFYAMHCRILLHSVYVKCQQNLIRTCHRELLAKLHATIGASQFPQTLPSHQSLLSGAWLRLVPARP